ncbi:MAG: metallophosphoesterase [Acetobacter sp.]|nr:metallophosphoesterase [Acetobacter sp.]
MKCILSSVRIAHFSDLHLPFSQFPRLREIRFKRVLSLLSWKLNRRYIYQWEPLAAIIQDIHQARPDFTAITGDMINFGLFSEFFQARHWLQKQHLPPTLLVLGNHEILIHENHHAKKALLNSWLREDSKNTRLPTLIDKGIALIGLNTAVPSLPFLAIGRIEKKQLALLETCLQETRSAGLCRIVILHHPPVRHLVRHRKALIDLEALQEIFYKNGTELILHGHSHRATITTIPRTEIPVIGTTSASHIPSSPQKAAGWNCIDIQSSPDSWHITVQRRALTAPHNLQNDAQPHTFIRPRPSIQTSFSVNTHHV